MSESAWLASSDPQEMLELLDGRASDRKLRLFAVACCRLFSEFLVMEESRRALGLAEEFADNRAGMESLQSAFAEAREIPGKLATKGNYIQSAAAAAASAEADAWQAASRAAYLIYDAAKPLVAKTPDGKVVEAYPVIRDCEVAILRDIFGNPFRQVTLEADWGNAGVLYECERVYEENLFQDLHFLGKQLEGAGLADEDILQHCCSGVTHVKGCWAVDLLLGKA